MNQQEDLRSVFIEGGNQLLLNDKNILEIDSKVNLNLEIDPLAEFHGYIHKAGILKLASDTSLVSMSENISEIFYDPMTKQSIIHFSNAGYFALSPGDATIITDIQEISKTTFDIQAYPNPSDCITNIEIESKIKENVVLKIIDNKGHAIYADSKVLKEGFNKITVNLSPFPKGIYLLSLISKNTFKTIKLGRL